MATSQPWFVAERAEALAVLYLTRHKDVEVIPVSRYLRHLGYDLLVRVTRPGTKEAATFAVAVKGMRNSTRHRDHAFRVNHKPEELDLDDLPVAVFLFDVDTEQGFTRWLAEPVVTRHGEPELRRNPDVAQHPTNNGGATAVDAHFDDLDNSAVATIIDRVVQWHEAKTYSPSR